MTFERGQLPDPQTYFESQGLVLQRGGKWRSTSCPFHGSTDSMRVNLETGAGVCMAGCGAKFGDIVAFHMAMHGLRFVEAAKDLGAWKDGPPQDSHARLKPIPFGPREALKLLHAEATLCAVAAANLANGVELLPTDLLRLLKAARNIAIVAEAVA